MSRTILTLAFFCLTSSLAWGQTNPPPQEKPPITEDTSRRKGPIDPNKPAGPHGSMDKAKAKSSSIRGAVIAIDAASMTITVKGKSGDVIATWDDKTTITPKSKTSADVKVGDFVTVWYKVAGDTKTVTKVVLHPVKEAGRHPSR